MNINKLVRPNILNLKPYQSARDEFKGTTGIFLDANENPYGNLNRYPDAYQNALKERVSDIKKVPANQIFIGNGSDETIDLAMRIFCEPGKDKIMICPPTYGMYKVAADINNIDIVETPLTPYFQLNIDDILAKSADKNIKILFLCSPNNPTGNSLKNIDKIIREFQGIVFLDEAYIEFSKQKSFLSQLSEYPNLIISQTFSKARGLANARIGMAFSSTQIIELYNKIKPPYNVSGINQKAALENLNDDKIFSKNMEQIITQRQYLLDNFRKLPIIQKIYPTDANFILIECKNATKVYTKLVQQGIIIRNRNSQIANTLRISVGTPHESKTLLKALKSI